MSSCAKQRKQIIGTKQRKQIIGVKFLHIIVVLCLNYYMVSD